jgi:hypothetical protein
MPKKDHLANSRSMTMELAGRGLFLVRESRVVSKAATAWLQHECHFKRRK